MISEEPAVMVKYLADMGANSSKERKNLPSIMMGSDGSAGGGRG